jgi:hypothetical protein
MFDDGIATRFCNIAMMKTMMVTMHELLIHAHPHVTLIECAASPSQHAFDLHVASSALPHADVTTHGQ